MRRWCLVAAFVGLAAAVPVRGDRAADALVATLRQAISRGDRAAVAALVKFPLTVFIGGLRMPIADAAALVERYDLIFTPELKDAIARANAEPADGGFTVGGAVTLQPVAGTLKIVGLTVPSPSSGSRATPEEGRSARRSAAPRRQPRRVVVRGSDGTSEVAGAIAPGATDAYVVWAAKNQLVQVRIEGVRGRDVIARVADARTGAPLDDRARQGVRNWAGRAPQAGDYRIDVARTAPGGEPIGYRLIIVVR